MFRRFGLYHTEGFHDIETEEITVSNCSNGMEWEYADYHLEYEGLVNTIKRNGRLFNKNQILAVESTAGKDIYTEVVNRLPWDTTPIMLTPREIWAILESASDHDVYGMEIEHPNYGNETIEYIVHKSTDLTGEDGILKMYQTAQEAEYPVLNVSDIIFGDRPHDVTLSQVNEPISIVIHSDNPSPLDVIKTLEKIYF